MYLVGDKDGADAPNRHPLAHVSGFGVPCQERDGKDTAIEQLLHLLLELKFCGSHNLRVNNRLILCSAHVRHLLLRKRVYERVSGNHVHRDYQMRRTVTNTTKASVKRSDGHLTHASKEKKCREQNLPEKDGMKLLA